MTIKKLFLFNEKSLLINYQLSFEENLIMKCSFHDPPFDLKKKYSHNSIEQKIFLKSTLCLNINLKNVQNLT